MVPAPGKHLGIPPNPYHKPHQRSQKIHQGASTKLIYCRNNNRPLSWQLQLNLAWRKTDLDKFALWLRILWQHQTSVPGSFPTWQWVEIEVNQAMLGILRALWSSALIALQSRFVRLSYYWRSFIYRLHTSPGHRLASLTSAQIILLFRKSQVLFFFRFINYQIYVMGTLKLLSTSHPIIKNNSIYSCVKQTQ